MRQQIDFYGSLLFSPLFFVLVYDCGLWFTGGMRQVPDVHKQVLLTGFLLWFISLVAGRHRDDDWVGQI